MIITTSTRPDENAIESAKKIAISLEGIFQFRNKRAISLMKEDFQDDILVVGKVRIELHAKNANSPFFFHPNSSMFRIKRLERGEEDPLVTACQLEKGDSFLDCTLGLASDSIVASYIVGKTGNVTGLERSEKLAYLVETGLSKWKTEYIPVDEAMQRIQVYSRHHLDYLKGCEDHSIDVIYFDPMFEETIEESVALVPLKPFANYSDLKTETILEARRVAKKRVVLKDHYKSTRFDRYGFSAHIRKSSKFHYGVIEI
ncbi:class I SAM-dependent methyltransferase [Metabacillus sp. HB246100]